LRSSNTEFTLTDIGVYSIFFQVSVTEPGQLVISVDEGVGFFELPYTVVGRATGTSQIVGLAYIRTSAINALVSIWNPTGNSTALTITPVAGGNDPVSAHLAITQLE
jgi:hypothetical protein